MSATYEWTPYPAIDGTQVAVDLDAGAIYTLSAKMTVGAAVKLAADEHSIVEIVATEDVWTENPWRDYITVFSPKQSAHARLFYGFEAVAKAGGKAYLTGVCLVRGDSRTMPDCKELAPLRDVGGGPTLDNPGGPGA